MNKQNLAPASGPSETGDRVEPQPRTAADRLRELWPSIRQDAEALRDVANPITPTDRLLHLWEASILEMPAVRTGSVAQQILLQLPAEIDHLLLVPWLGISGGSEKVTQRLVHFLASLNRNQRVAILAPDVQFDLSPAQRLRYDVSIVAFNDFERDLCLDERVALLELVLRQAEPRTVHVINSDVAWAMLHAAGTRLPMRSRVFVNIYSDLRWPDGTPAAYFWRYMPNILHRVAGVLVDNAAVIARAAACFSLVPEQLAKFHMVPTPILGPQAALGLQSCRPFMRGAPRHTLWMSRIAQEKRLDVVQAIAARLPDRGFSIYSSTMSNTVPDRFLDWTRATPNVSNMGALTNLDALPLHDFDSYLFTTSAEGMPLSLLEATALGLPTVAPSVGGIGEFIDETTGWLVVEPDDADSFMAALEDIAARPEEAARRVGAAQRRLEERHSWTALAHALSAIPHYLTDAGGSA